MPHRRFRLVAVPARASTLVAGLLVLTTVGCRKQEEIHTLVVSRDIEEANNKLLAEWRATSQAARKPTAEAAPAKPGRLLGALLPHGEETWTFKMLGDAEAVTKHVDEVRALIGSVKFAGDKPAWTLPAGWTQKADPGTMRFATLVVGDTTPPLELAIAVLPGSQNIADNVNRWRGQVQLPPESPAEAEKSAVELPTGAGAARWVDLTGMYSASSGMPPFARMGGAAGGLPSDHPPIGASPMPTGAGRGSTARPAGPPPDSPVKYALPEGWQPGAPTQFAVASFTVADGPKQLRITISNASGDLLLNVNRWRGQLQLPPIDQNTLDTAVTKMKVDGRSADYIELLGMARGGPQQAIYGVVIADSPQSSWFIKLMGDASLALREREHFQAFVFSLNFPKK